MAYRGLPFASSSEAGVLFIELGGVCVCVRSAEWVNLSGCSYHLALLAFVSLPTFTSKDFPNSCKGSWQKSACALPAVALAAPGKNAFGRYRQVWFKQIPQGNQLEYLGAMWVDTGTAWQEWKYHKAECRRVR